MTTRGQRGPFRFAMLFLPLFAVLAWPFPSIGRGCRFLVCGAINGMIMNSTRTSRVARLVPDQRSGFEWHCVVAVWNQTTRSVEEQFPVDVHQVFYLPTSVFIALTLAGKYTGGSKRVVLKLLIGMALIQLRSTLPFIARERIVVGIAQDGLFDLLLFLVNRSLVAPLGMAFALPLLLWFGLFRRSLVRGTNERPTAP